MDRRTAPVHIVAMALRQALQPSLYELVLRRRTTLSTISMPTNIKLLRRVLLSDFNFPNGVKWAQDIMLEPHIPLFTTSWSVHALLLFSIFILCLNPLLLCSVHSLPQSLLTPEI